MELAGKYVVVLLLLIESISITRHLYQLLTADVPAPLPDKEHTVRTKYRITKEEHVKEQKRKHILEILLISIQCWLPTHDESQRPKKCNSMLSLYMWPHAFGKSSGSIS